MAGWLSEERGEPFNVTQADTKSVLCRMPCNTKCIEKITENLQGNLKGQVVNSPVKINDTSKVKRRVTYKARSHTNDIRNI